MQQAVDELHTCWLTTPYQCLRVVGLHAGGGTAEGDCRAGDQDAGGRSTAQGWYFNRPLSHLAVHLPELHLRAVSHSFKACSFAVAVFTCMQDKQTIGHLQQLQLGICKTKTETDQGDRSQVG